MAEKLYPFSMAKNRNKLEICSFILENMADDKIDIDNNQELYDLIANLLTNTPPQEKVVWLTGKQYGQIKFACAWVDKEGATA